MLRPLTNAARLILAAALAAALTLALAAIWVDRSGPSSTRTSPAAASADDAVDQVIAISVDGLNPEAIRRLGRSGAPNFYRLIDNGATTLDARTDNERTITLPNHTSMVTGRWVTTSGGHKVTFNDDNGGTVHRTAGGYVRSMFDVVHNRGGSTAFYSAKDKFNFLNRSWNGTYGAADTVGANNGRDKIDRYYVDSEYANVTRLVKRLRTAPDELSFVHLAYPDRSGHLHGFMSARYVHAVHQADTQIGRILDAVRASTRLRQHVNVVLTADHGGQGASHSDPTKAYNYTIPFMVWGVGVPAGTDLYSVNTDDRSRPGTARTTYSSRQPIRNGEMANLVTDLLDMPAVPGSTFDTRQDLSVR